MCISREHQEAAAATTRAYTDQELCRYLDKPENRGSPRQSAWHLCQTLVAIVAWWWFATQAVSFPTIGRVVLSVVWGLLVVRSFMVFHDCGHGSFFQGPHGSLLRYANWVTLHFTSFLCGTPTDWNVGHSLHHASVGNTGQDDYDWAETIFHLRSSYVKLPPWKQRAWKVLRHPVIFFSLAPALTWYLKMRLPFELRPGRKAAYRFSDKMLNLASMVARYWLATRLGVLDMVLGGDYIGMFGGVLLFHWQHVYDPGYVRGGAMGVWKLRYAAMHGSSIITIPESLKWFTMGIEYHHIHHFRTRVPGYKLRAVHEQAPPDMWSQVVTLYPKDMWRSLWLSIYDDIEMRYSTFDEVLALHAAAREKVN